MKSGIRSPRLFSATIIFLSVLVFYLPAFAFRQGPPSIKIVDVDLVSKSITIYGNDFIQSSNKKIISLPEVSLAGDPLEVTSYTNDQINALLPADITDGSYLLEVLAANSKSKYATFDLTIGATGLTGPQGPQGIQGPPGASGTSVIPYSYTVSQTIWCGQGTTCNSRNLDAINYSFDAPKCTTNGDEIINSGYSTALMVLSYVSDWEEVHATASSPGMLNYRIHNQELIPFHMVSVTAWIRCLGMRAIP